MLKLLSAEMACGFRWTRWKPGTYSMEGPAHA
jgi:hypothetical protein